MLVINYNYIALFLSRCWSMCQSLSLSFCQSVCLRLAAEQGVLAATGQTLQLFCITDRSKFFLWPDFGS